MSNLLRLPRIHLSTLIALVFVASLLLFLNLGKPRLLSARITGSEERVLPHCVERTVHIAADFKMRGWPTYASPDCTTSVVIKEEGNSRQFNFDSDNNLIDPVDARAVALKEFPISDMERGPLYGFWTWKVIFVNFLVAIAILLCTGAFLEYLARKVRHSARRSLNEYP